MRLAFPDTSPNTTAAGVSLLILCLPFIQVHRWARSIQLLTVFIIVTLVALTQSRSGLIGLSVALALLYCPKPSVPCRSSIFIITGVLVLLGAIGFYKRLDPDSLGESASLRFSMARLSLMQAAESQFLGVESPHGLAEDGFLRFGMDFTLIQRLLIQRPLGTVFELLWLPWWLAISLSALTIAPLIGCRLQETAPPLIRGLAAASAMVAIISVFNDLIQDRLGVALLMSLGALIIICLISLPGRLSIPTLRRAFIVSSVWLVLAWAGGAWLLHCAVPKIVAGKATSFIRLENSGILLVERPAIHSPGTLVLLQDEGNVEAYWRLRRAMYATVEKGWRVIEVRNDHKWTTSSADLLEGDRTIFITFGGSKRPPPKVRSGEVLQLVIDPRPIDYLVQAPESSLAQLKFVLTEAGNVLGQRAAWPDAPIMSLDAVLAQAPFSPVGGS